MIEVSNNLEGKKIEDEYMIGEENIIYVIHSDEDTGYTMVHKRLKDNKLVEINR